MHFQVKLIKYEVCINLSYSRNPLQFGMHQFESPDKTNQTKLIHKMYINRLIYVLNKLTVILLRQVSYIELFIIRYITKYVTLVVKVLRINYTFARMNAMQTKQNTEPIKTRGSDTLIYRRKKTAHFKAPTRKLNIYDNPFGYLWKYPFYVN